MLTEAKLSCCHLLGANLAPHGTACDYGLNEDYTDSMGTFGSLGSEALSGQSSPCFIDPKWPQIFVVGIVLWNLSEDSESRDYRLVIRS